MTPTRSLNTLDVHTWLRSCEARTALSKGGRLQDEFLQHGGAHRVRSPHRKGFISGQVSMTGSGQSSLSALPK